MEEKPSTHSNSKEDNPWHRPSLLESVLKRFTQIRTDIMHRDVVKQAVLPTEQTQDLQRNAWQLSSPDPLAHSRRAVLHLSHSRDHGAQRVTGCSAPAASGARRQRVFRLEWQGTHVQGVDLPKATLPPASQAEAPLLKHPHFGKLTTSQSGKRVRTWEPAEPYSHKLQPPPINVDWSFFTRQYSGWSNG